MESVSCEQNFGGFQLGDKRLNRRALSIARALGQQFGQSPINRI